MESAPRTHATAFEASNGRGNGGDGGGGSGGGGGDGSGGGTSYMGAPIPQHHCVLRRGMEVCHARTRGRFEGDGSNGVCLPTSSGREPGSGAANATPEEFKCWEIIQGAV